MIEVFFFAKKSDKQPRMCKLVSLNDSLGLHIRAWLLQNPDGKVEVEFV